MVNIEKQLRSDERVLWQGKPVLGSFVLSINLFPVILGIVFIVFFLWFFFLPMISFGAPLEFVLFSLVFVFIGSIFSFGMPISAYLSHKNTEYLISNQRVITQTGAIGIDLRSIDLEKIQEVNVRVGFVDTLFKTGNIFVGTASQMYGGWQRGPGWYGSFNTRPNLAAIKEPYEVQSLLQEAIQHVKQPKS